MSKLYSIQESTLTDIGDALRGKYGETRLETINAPYVISKTPNATGHDSFEGALPSTGRICNVVRIPGAVKIEIDFTYETYGAMYGTIQVTAGEYTVNNFPSAPTSHSGNRRRITMVFENTDVITFYYQRISSYNESYYNYLGYYAECYGYDANGYPIEVEGCSYIEKEIEVINTYSSADVAEAIEELPDIPEPIVLSGNCDYALKGELGTAVINHWGNIISTEAISSAANMFDKNQAESIPFDINCITTTTGNFNTMFGSTGLKTLPKVIGAYPTNASGLFYYSRYLRHIPMDFFDTWNFNYWLTATSGYSGNISGSFRYCYSLRSLPMTLFKNHNPRSNYNYSYFASGFENCYCLDELVDLPIPYTANWTSSVFSNTFYNCCRLKRITFETNEDGTPKIVNWKGQTMDLEKVGYFETQANKNPNDYATDKGSLASFSKYFTDYNSGITVDKVVCDDATYQALKDDPDWFCVGTKYYPDVNYSRYNHDSAVETINSLPDTSAYLATAGGTNTIKFHGASGSATDGGAINTLTEEEIAVATARGWTVSLS